jgi:hypothetical protein
MNRIFGKFFSDIEPTLPLLMSNAIEFSKHQSLFSSLINFIGKKFTR